MIPKVVIKWNIHLVLIILNHFPFRQSVVLECEADVVWHFLRGNNFLITK